MVIEEHYVNRTLAQIMRDRFNVWVVPVNNTYSLVVENSGFVVKTLGLVTSLEESILAGIWGKVPHSQDEATKFAQEEDYNF